MTVLSLARLSVVPKQPVTRTSVPDQIECW